MLEKVLRTMSVIAVLFVGASAFAKDVKVASLKGKWAFDHMNPEKTKCVQIDDTWVKKVSASGAACKTQSAGYSEKYPGPVIVCESKKLNQMILDSKEICVDNLETENLNAP